MYENIISKADLRLKMDYIGLQGRWEYPFIQSKKELKMKKDELWIYLPSDEEQTIRSMRKMRDRGLILRGILYGFDD